MYWDQLQFKLPELVRRQFAMYREEELTLTLTLYSVYPSFTLTGGLLGPATVQTSRAGPAPVCSLGAAHVGGVGGHHSHLVCKLWDGSGHVQRGITRRAHRIAGVKSYTILLCNMPLKV